ncbi:zf-TFIIB domain-containing protein [Roseateles sp. LYH14W]
MPDSRPCPSCHDAMEVHVLPGQYSGEVEIDFCFGCQGLWFDHMENLKLAPEAIVTMFKAMHQHRDARHQPLAERLNCPQCSGPLAQGFDIVRSGRYITHRCASRHGRFSSFSSFMIEKGFVRQLTRPEIADIAAKVGVINCSNCGAPVDLRKEDACSHCRSALSLLDPQAVEKALQNYAHAPSRQGWGSPTDVGDALVAIAREQSRAQRQAAGTTITGPAAGVLGVDLFSAGLALVAELWSSA